VANPSKAKGTKAETDLVRWLQTQGHSSVERRALHGNADRGDIIGLPSMVVSVKMRKAGAAMDWSGWLNDLRGMVTNATPAGMDDLCGLLVVKRTGYPDPGRWYAVQELHAWFDLYGGLMT
jgi:hypothetical protein